MRVAFGKVGEKHESMNEAMYMYEYRKCTISKLSKRKIMRPHTHEYKSFCKIESKGVYQSLKISLIVN